MEQHGENFERTCYALFLFIFNVEKYTLVYRNLDKYNVFREVIYRQPLPGGG